MVTKIWNGTDADYATAADWSPAGVPAAGDTAIIHNGTVTLEDTLLSGLVVQVLASSTGAPDLVVTDSVLDPYASLQITAAANNSTLTVAAGMVTAGLLNAGLLALSGDGTGTATMLLPGSTSGAILTNNGTMTLEGNTQVALSSSNFATGLVNNGVVSISNGTGAFRLSAVRVAVSGTGTIGIGNAAYGEFSQAVGTGQTLQFAAGAATVQLDAGNQFQGTLSGFTTGDKVILAGTPYSTVNYKTTGPSSGALVFSQNGVALDTIAFSGNYALNSFALSTSQSGNTTIAASGAAPQRVAFTDTAANTSGGDPATYYTGPVNYLQWQYIWNSADGVAMAGQADNMFLHGGSGADAITAHGGSNVIDGGGGSNFLVGATGADGGTDTFFVDGRGGSITWSSIVNFHHGDSVTVFGFTGGTSTLPLVNSDGAAGFTGATIHSELNGANTGVNGSITFVGVSGADAQDVSNGGKFTYQFGNLGGTTPYMNITYTG